MERNSFIPLLGSFFPRFLYDPILFISGLGKHFKRSLSTYVEAPLDSFTILDVGCGTGTHSSVLAEDFPNARVVCLDPDPNNIILTRTKCQLYENRMQYLTASAENITLPNGVIDVCFSTLTFHHLTTKLKKEALSEIYRVMKPGGTFVLTDWGISRFRYLRWLLIFETQELLNDHFDGKITTFAREAGFVLVKEVRVKPSGIWMWKFSKPN